MDRPFPNFVLLQTWAKALPDDWYVAYEECRAQSCPIAKWARDNGYLNAMVSSTCIYSHKNGESTYTLHLMDDFVDYADTHLDFQYNKNDLLYCLNNYACK